MTTVTSKFSTSQGYEADNYVEVKPLRSRGGQGLGAPAIETDKSGTQFAVSALGPDLIVMHISEATQLRTAGLVDF